MGKSIALIDGDSVGDTITRVKDNTGGAARRIQREHSLDVDIHGRDVEGLEHDLSHALTVRLGVERSLSQQDRVLLWGHTELVVEGMMPDLLHIVPVGDDTVLNGVLQGEHTSLGLSLISDVGILLVHANHDTRMLGAAHNGRKDSARSVISSQTSLAHTRSIVNHKSLNVVVCHFCKKRKKSARLKKEQKMGKKYDEPVVGCFVVRSN
jgi:hypothetical protein